MSVKMCWSGDEHQLKTGICFYFRDFGFCNDLATNTTVELSFRISQYCEKPVQILSFKWFTTAIFNVRTPL